MNSKQQRFVLCTLKKIIKEYYPDGYGAWLQKYNSKIKTAVALQLKLTYKQGASVKLSEVKATYGNHLNAAKLLEMNREFTVSKKHICKSCLNKHKLNCCDKYIRNAQSTAMFVNNAELV
jgi:hypothetical protein